MSATVKRDHSDTERPIACERPMPKYIRRSLLSLAINDPRLGERAYDSWADAIILDLSVEDIHCSGAELASRMPAVIERASRGGAELLVRIDSGQAGLLEAVVHPGIVGVVLKGASEPQQIEHASRLLDSIEPARGLDAQSVEIDIELNSAAGVWNSLDMVRASTRFGTLSLAEVDLYNNLQIPAEPRLTVEPIEYIKSQLITVATSVGGQAIGLGYPLSLTPMTSDEADVVACIRRARDTGFKGAVCKESSWIRLCNAGFRPTPEEVDYYHKVRSVFAEGLARGLASVPLEGKMIDIPVDLRAKVYLEWADRAHVRDQQKGQAHRSNSGAEQGTPS